MLDQSWNLNEAIEQKRFEQPQKFQYKPSSMAACFSEAIEEKYLNLAEK